MSSRVAAQIVGSFTDSSDNTSTIKLVRPHVASTSTNGPQDNVVDGETANQWISQASKMLYDYWPKGGSVDLYAEKIIHKLSQPESYGLPCSYLLVLDGKCVGHARLSDCFESNGVNAAAATYVIVSQDFRGKKLGSKLMKLIEAEAENLGYQYMYLWTRDAVPFYQKCGYMVCEKVSLYRPCLKMLKQTQLTGLENMLARHLKTVTSSTPRSKGNNGGEGFQDQASDADDVWLRKRLVEFTESSAVSIEDQLSSLSERVNDILPEARGQCLYSLLQVPWQKQIGPSCGLAALRMVRDYLHSREPPADGTSSKMPSLLLEAKERGFSQDGEIFDVKNLKTLAEEVCGIEAILHKFSSTSQKSIVGAVTSGKLLIIPYDCHSGSKLPGNFLGRSAHYGIIVGVAFLSASNEEKSNDTDTDEGSISMVEFQGAEIPDIDPSELILAVQHSNSSKLAVAPMSEFVESNLQMIAVDDSRFAVKTLHLADQLMECRGLNSTGSGNQP